MEAMSKNPILSKVNADVLKRKLKRENLFTMHGHNVTMILM